MVLSCIWCQLTASVNYLMAVAGSVYFYLLLKYCRSWQHQWQRNKVEMCEIETDVLL